MLTDLRGILVHPSLCRRSSSQRGAILSVPLLNLQVASGSDRGQECEKIMRSGGLVPVVVTLDLLKEAMLSAYDSNPRLLGYLIDGFPRELSQGKAFKSKVIVFDISALSNLVSPRLRLCYLF